ncbi:hypothetical protein LAJ19_06525 [Deinococcus taeanensis]|uniref:YchJ family protein n=1 Tax=Deinococcus taeanensis TaxID=2737050 RepID=UPI001CDC10C0|nr:YchJ family metal-binding protein [Deinococcus taeanensis]UBV43865.1 hypothetical protein LAJ19_06525 [Deinococcus taeanensis]
MPVAYPTFKSCPCGTGRSYGHCCGPLHAGQQAAATPEALMRSRYAAYALGDAEYVQRTWHVHTRPGTLDLRDGTRYVGLRVDSSGDDWVSFTAQLKLPDGQKYVLRERSRFVQVDGAWVYLDGETPDA